MRRVAAEMAGAEAPWWVIGSAAVGLHGVAVEPADVDVLLSERDAETILRRLRLTDAAGDGHPQFRSVRLARWRAPPVTVEFMAGLTVWRGDGWTPVAPRTRVGVGGVYVPERAELAAILAAFGRPKDLVRAALLTPARGTA